MGAKEQMKKAVIAMEFKRMDKKEKHDLRTV
jgi:hypothetical protein